jgi:rubredoxin
MKNSFTIKINFTGGIISPGDLMNILSAATAAGVKQVSFGLRQQLFMEVVNEDFDKLADGLKNKSIAFEVGTDMYPNIVSSYPAEEIFIINTWLSEGVYKDIFDGFGYTPKLKINISDSKQSFTPLLTGNINWVASDSLHYWHLFIRFPKTNCIYEWPDIVYTNDIAAMTQHLEKSILSNNNFFDKPAPDGKLLYNAVKQQQEYNAKKAEGSVELPPFMLPYYEGFNRSNNRYWLGIYRRDEKFSVKFLQELCTLCLATKIGQLCSTPWKSIIIKGIEEKDRGLWDAILGKYQVNVRHAANELNFQVEDDCKDGLALKNYLIKHLQQDDTRTFGICIGIKTRRKSEVFSSILVKRKPLFTIAGVGFFHRYDILCSKQFNPNERTGYIFSNNNFRWLLPEQLRRAIIGFYAYKENDMVALHKKKPKMEIAVKETVVELTHQCKNCLTIYDEMLGEPENGILPATAFEDLPSGYCCPLCDAPKSDFVKIDKSALMYVEA